MFGVEIKKPTKVGIILDDILELESVLEEGRSRDELGSKAKPRSESLKISAHTDVPEFPAVFFIFVTLIFVMKH